MISCHGSSNSRGVAILFKNGIDCSINRKTVDPEGRYIILKACIQDKDYVLINLYAPNKNEDQVNFFNNLLSMLQNENLDSEDNIILGGDLNCPLDPLLDKKGGASTKRKSVISFVEDFKSKLDLVDIWRSKNPDAKSFTWSQKSPPVFCRLDYWLISNNLSDFVELTEIIPAVRTDHDAISLELGKLESELKGPGNWKMKERGKKEHDLQEELTKAKSKLEGNPNDHNKTYYNVFQEKLESFYEEKTKGVIIRARARWHEHGEKSTKYFLNLGKRNHVKKHIRKLCINGKITMDPHCILKEQERFYRELYKSSINIPNIGEKISSFLNILNIPQLSEEEKNSCEGLISPEECSELLDSFQNNKSLEMMAFQLNAIENFGL